MVIFTKIVIITQKIAYLWKVKAIILDFSGVYGAQGFTGWLENRQVQFIRKDLSAVEGTSCYCSPEAEESILAALPEEIPPVRWIDSGDYHYMSHLLAGKEKEPFHLLLLDHHPDDQEPAFDGEILSCGSWVKAMREGNPLLKDVLMIGPEGCPEDIPEGWMDQRRGERLYVSLDKDIMSKEFARTDWSQGEHSLKAVKTMLTRVLEGPMKLAAIDVCGEMAPSKGATGEDQRINLNTNTELYKLITKYL